MDFGIFLDFVLRPGGTPEEAFKESFDLVDLAEQLVVKGSFRKQVAQTRQTYPSEGSRPPIPRKRV